MNLTWIAIIASLPMGIGPVSFFIRDVKKPTKLRRKR
jgi:hypothetical protein